MPELLNKELKVMASAGFNEKYGGIEAMLYTKLAMEALRNHPVDMLVFEETEGIQTIRSAGYFLDGREVSEKNNYGLDETTELWSDESLPTDKFWFKIDDHEDFFVGTFLFPEDY